MAIAAPLRLPDLPELVRAVSVPLGTVSACYRVMRKLQSFTHSPWRRAQRVVAPGSVLRHIQTNKKALAFNKVNNPGY